MDLRRSVSVASILGAGLLAGCVTTRPKPPEATRAVAPAPTPDANDPLPPGLTPKFMSFLTSQGLSSAPAKDGEPARLVTAWNNKIIYAPDPVHGGEPVPGFLAKLWLFGPEESIPITPDGEILVGMWDNSAKATGGQPALLELWHIDRETAKKFRKRDFMGGDAYTLFLPSSKYHVDLKQVNVVARYNGADGRCLSSPPETLTIDHSATLQRAAEKLGTPKLDALKSDLPAPAPLPFPAPAGRP
jgi:hypothetical protein